MMNSQRSNTKKKKKKKKINLIEEGKEIGIDEVTKCNDFIHNSLKFKKGCHLFV